LLRIIKDMNLNEDEQIMFDTVKQFLTKDIYTKYGKPELVLKIAVEILTKYHLLSYKVYLDNLHDFNERRKKSFIKLNCRIKNIHPSGPETIVVNSIMQYFYDIGFIMSNIAAYKKRKKSDNKVKNRVLGIPTLCRLFMIRKLIHQLSYNKINSPEQMVKLYRYKVKANVAKIYRLEKHFIGNFNVSLQDKLPSNTSAGRIELLQIRGSHGKIIVEDERPKKQTKEKNQYYVSHPSESPDLLSWGKREIGKWTDTNIVGYFASRFVSTFECEDVEICGQRPHRIKVVGMIKRFKKVYFLDAETDQNVAIKNYIDWAFQWIEENSWYESFNIRNMFKVDKNYILGCYRKSNWKKKVEVKKNGNECDWTAASNWKI